MKPGLVTDLIERFGIEVVPTILIRGEFYARLPAMKTFPLPPPLRSTQWTTSAEADAIQSHFIRLQNRYAHMIHELIVTKE